MSETEIRVRAVQDQALAIVAAKNDNYGSSWRNQGWLGNVSRILEKSDRLRSMLWNNANPLLSASNEHPRETMLDMMNTLAFAIVNMDDGVERGNEPQAASILGTWGVDTQSYHSGHSPVPVRTEGWPPQDQWQAAPHPSEGLALDTNEQTLVDVPVPGEEKPSPTKRVAIQDRGSGPRKRPVKDAPQA